MKKIALSGLALAVFPISILAFSSDAHQKFQWNGRCTSASQSQALDEFSRRSSIGEECSLPDDPVVRWMGLNLDLTKRGPVAAQDFTSRNLACDFHPPMAKPVCS
jgi:hypothetical protein